MMKLNFILIIAMILLQSCSENRYDAVDLRLKLNKASNSGNNSDTKAPVDETGDEYNAGAEVENPNEMSYKNVLNQVLQAKCLNCHSEKGGNRGHLNLETYQSVFNNREQIREEVITKKMPKKSQAPLTDEQIKLIVDWIDARTKEFATTEPPPTEETPEVVPPVIPPVEVPETPLTPPPDSIGEPPVIIPEPTLPPVADPPPVEIPSTEPVDLANMNYASVMKLVIEPKCLKCHNTGAKNGIELVTYADLQFQKEDIKKDVESGEMPRKDTLTGYEKKLILDWIATDMPE